MAENAQSRDFRKIVPGGYESTDTERFIRFLLVEMGRCSYEVNGMEAGLIVDSVLLLLQRLEISKNLPPTQDHREMTMALTDGSYRLLGRLSPKPPHAYRPEVPPMRFDALR